MPFRKDRPAIDISLCRLLGSFDEEIYVTQHDEVSGSPRGKRLELHVKLRGMTYIASTCACIGYGVPDDSFIRCIRGRGNLNCSKMEDV